MMRAIIAVLILVIIALFTLSGYLIWLMEPFK